MRNLRRNLFMLALGAVIPLLSPGVSGGVACAADRATPPSDLAWNDHDCGRLMVTEGSHAGRAGALRITGYHATLDAPDGGAGHAAHLDARSLRTDGPASLDPLPALFAGGLMIGLLETKPRSCDLQHGFERAAELVANLPEGSSANQRWSNVDIVAARNTVAANAIRLHVESDAHDLMRVVEDIDGFSSAGDDPTASPIGHVTVRVSAPRSRLQALARGQTLDPSDTVTVEQVSMVSGDSRIDAHGFYHPATRSGHLLVHAIDMEGIRGAFPASIRDRVGAAFLILRLAAKQEAGGALSWVVDYTGQNITVNGVSLPTSY